MKKRRCWKIGCIVFGMLLLLNWDGSAFVLAQQSSRNTTLQVVKVDSIKPGMVGEGYTTLKGSKPIRFEVEILGVIPNIFPNFPLIIGKIRDDQFQRMGVFAGMSGSPVYINGRLLGAVAYAFPFSREPIAGIVPFEIMSRFQQNAAITGRRRNQNQALLTPEERETLTMYLMGDTNKGAFIHDIFQRRLGRAPEEMTKVLQQGFRPIPTPISGGSFWSSWTPNRLVNDQLFLLPITSSVVMQSSSSPASPREPVEPGMPVAIPLVQGDLDLTAYGTITAVEGQRVYAFGHQLFNLGSIRFPMHRASVVTVVPSVQSSFVMASTDEPLGVLDTDVWTTISGRIGQAPPLSELMVEIGHESVNETYHYRLAQHPLLTPFLIQQIMQVNLVFSPLGGIHDGFVRVNMNINLQGYPELKVNNVFTGYSAGQESTQFVAAVLAFLLTNPFEVLTLDSLELKLNQSRENITATLVEARLNSHELVAGEEMELVITLHPRQGRVDTRAVNLNLPQELPPGQYTLIVGGARQMNQVDRAMYGRFIQFARLRDMFRVLKNIRPNDGLYIRLLRTNPTLLSEGKVLKNLPLQIFNQLRSRGTRGPNAVVPVETVMERRFEWPFVIEGVKQFQLTVKSRTRMQESQPVTVSEEDVSP